MKSINSMSRRDFLLITNAAIIGGAIAYIINRPLEMFRYELGYNVIGVFKGEEWRKTTCNLCGSACSLLTRVVDNKIVKLEGNPSYPINVGGVCPRAHVNIQFLYMKNRVTAPMIKVNHSLEVVSERKVLNVLSRKIEEAKGVYIVGSEVGTAQEILELLSLKSPDQGIFLTEPIEIPPINLSHYNYILLFGADLLSSSKYIMHNLREFSKLKSRDVGGKLVYISPRKSITGVKADNWICIRPGTYGALALGMISHLVEVGKFDKELVSSVLGGDYEVLDILVKKYNPLWASAVSGVEERVIRRIADQFYDFKPSIALVGNEALCWNNGSATYKSIVLLNALVGTRMISGWMDAPFKRLPGYQMVSRYISFNLSQVIDRAIKNTPSILIFINTDPFFEVPSGERFKELRNMDAFIISVTPFIRDFEKDVANIVIPFTPFTHRWIDGSTIANDGSVVAYISAPVLDEMTSLPKIALKILRENYGFEINDLYGAIRYRWVGIWNTQRGYVNGKHISQFKDFNEFFNNVLSSGFWIDEKLSLIYESNIGIDADFSWEEPIFIGDGRLTLHPYSTVILNLKFGECPWISQRPSALFPEEKFDTWIEVNPEDALNLGLKNGQLVNIEGPSGEVIVCKVRVYDGVCKGVIGIPLGLGRRINGWGVIGSNPIKLMTTRWKNVDYRDTPILYSTKVVIRGD